MGDARGSYIAECFWTGVSDEDVRDLDDRIRAVVAELSEQGQVLGYGGSLLMPTDEVVLCLFQGPEAVVRTAVERAAVPFDRIVPTTGNALTAQPTVELRPADGTASSG